MNRVYIHLNFKELNHVYKDRRKPALKPTNARLNSVPKQKDLSGDVPKYTFQYKFQYKDENPQITLVCNTPSQDKKSLEEVENRHIAHNAVIRGKRLLNKRCNPIVKKEEERKKLVEKVVIENETQLRKRVEEQEGKLAIKDSGSFFFFDAKVNGKRVKTMA